jgi:predicted dehydrogenase
MGRAWARNLSANPRVDLVGWIDVRPQAVNEAAAELGISVGYMGEELSAAFAGCKPDFVVDVTPPAVHHEVVVRTLGYGIPVIGEKPMADTMAEAREMVAASEKAGKLYMVSQSRRYDAGLVAYRDLILGELGGLGTLNVDFYIGAHFGGFRNEMGSPLILDMAIHTFDAARYLSGADPVSVYAEEFNPEWSWYAGDASAAALFEMANGLRFNFRGSWCSEGLPTSWDGDWRAIGPNGSAVWQKNGQPFAEIVEKRGGFTSETRSVVMSKPNIAEGIAGSLEEFLDALEHGMTPQGECHDNIKSLAMVFGAIKSNLADRRIPVEL